MKAKELMIGDWVQISEFCKYHGAIGRIKTLIEHKDNENAYFKVFLQNNTIHIGIEDICSDDIRPIPLTPEILEKNGFEKALQLSNTEPSDIDEEGNKHYSYNKTFWGWWQPDNILSIPANGLGWLNIKYVHQLQHALRLCGIEKEITL